MTEPNSIVTSSTSESQWPQWCSPRTRVPLRDVANELCSADGSERFAVRNGIPRFVADAAYADSFGSQWNRFRKTQLDSITGIPITRDRLEGALGPELWPKLAGLQVLECGCGAGRFTEVLLDQGANVTSIDLSSAVDANAENFPISPSHRIAQADIMSLPFAGQQFDVVICLGVIQHTPDPERTIAALYEHVRPGGWFVIDHYTFHAGRITSIRPIFRAYLKRLPRDKAMSAVERLVDRFLPWHSRLRSNRIGWTLLCRISPVTTYYRSIPDLPETLQREWALLDTHDSLTDWYKHLRNRDRIAATLSALGLVDIRCDYAGNGVEARGRRPDVSVARVAG